jgi:hypothetical protein
MMTTNKFFPVMELVDARAAGFKSLTKPYYLNHRDESIRICERGWWDAICHDLKDCKCVIVEFQNGVELWRHDDELDVDPMTGTKLPRNAFKE